jgi:acetyl esterase
MSVLSITRLTLVLLMISKLDGQICSWDSLFGELGSKMTNETRLFAYGFAQSVYESISITPEQILQVRKYQAISDAENNKNYKFPKLSIKQYKVKNLYDGYMIPVQAYIPKNKGPNTPITVYFHGGSFVYYSVASYYPTVGYIAQATNTIFLSVEYRLSPKYKFPKAVHDSLSVTKWVLDNKISLFGVNAKAKVGVAGDSAGGNLASVLANTFKNKLNFQILIYPWLDLSCSSSGYHENRFGDICFANDYASGMVGTRFYLNNDNEMYSPFASPWFNNNLKNEPRALIISAELDPLVVEATEYHHKLRKASIPSEQYVVPGVIHGFFGNNPATKNGFLQGAAHVIKFFKSL